MDALAQLIEERPGFAVLLLAAADDQVRAFPTMASLAPRGAKPSQRRLRTYATRTI